jgi:hypothetical protein
LAPSGVRPSYNEGVTFGYRIEDGLPDALLRAGGRHAWPWWLELADLEPLAAGHAPAADRDDPHNPARRKSCQIRSVFCSS